MKVQFINKELHLIPENEEDEKIVEKIGVADLEDLTIHGHSFDGTEFGHISNLFEIPEEINKPLTMNTNTVFTINVLLFQESTKWIAQCINWDIATQGKDIESVLKSFKKVFKGQILLDIKNDIKPLSTTPETPPIFKDQFEESIKLETKEHLDILTWIIDSNSVDVNLNFRIKSK